MHLLETLDPQIVTRDLAHLDFFAEAWGVCYARRKHLELPPQQLCDKAKAKWEKAVAAREAVKGDEIEVRVNGERRTLRHCLTIMGSDDLLAVALHQIADGFAARCTLSV